jgi:O-antigen/teichoic acid export membrane protein
VAAAAESGTEPGELSEERVAPKPGSGAASVRWSALAVIGRQLAQMLCALLVARLLGPESYGVISAATVYVTLTTLILDQGLAAALVQRPSLPAKLAGAVASANLLTSALLGLATWLLAPLVADFFGTDHLVWLLRVLAVGLLLKAVAITPRALLMRNLRFKGIAVADLLGGSLGAAAGVTAAFLGAGYWSMAWQVLSTDLVVAGILIAVNRAGAPNLALGELRAILPFSLRIFGSNSLAFFSRNSDNILVGRFLGVTSLSHYSMAYRVLVIPVQMIGQTVNRVAFPTFSRLVDQPERLAANLVKITELLAMTAVLPMLYVAVAAGDLIHVVLGPAWAATAPVLTILAVAGARETVFYVSGSLMRAKGYGKLIFRYEILATILQVGGIVVGLQFGLIGVALGITISGFLLAPVLLVIQHRLTGVSIARQLGSILRPAHASVWGVGAYLAVGLLGWSPLATAAAGFLAYALAAGTVLFIVHRAAMRRTLDAARGLVGAKAKAARSAS